MYNAYKFDNMIYKVALYIRLSREDGDDLESESVSNQRSLLVSFLKENNLEAVDIYIDDGFSGGNFERPSFKRMIEDIENKKINCVITKDLSRLGRDYIETGRYIERYFPEHYVRYIALNDDIDTFNETCSGSDLMPFRLGMNDMYAKDISKKVKSSLYEMKRNGLFCGSAPSYGYIRSPEDKHFLIPDPETAPIVKRIFDLYIAGYSSSSIADILTKEKVPTPVLIRNYKKELARTSFPEIWKQCSINNILKNRVYTGCVIQHTSKSINYKTKKRRKVPKDEWMIVENKNPAIIDKTTFEIAQEIRNKSNNYNPNRRKVDYLFADLVYCKDCGSRMSISYDKKRNRITMNCNNYRKFSKYDVCFSHYINYEKLEKSIYYKLREKSLIYKNNMEEFHEELEKNYIDPVSNCKSNIEQEKNKIHILRKKQDSLYDDKFQGIINIDTYQRLYNKTENEIEVSTNKLKYYELELENMSKNPSLFLDNVQVIEDFLNMKNPTKEMLNKIIKRIEVTKDKQLEIHYRIREDIVPV